MSQKSLYQSIIRSTGIHIGLILALAIVVYHTAKPNVDQAFELQLESVHVHEYQPKAAKARVKTEQTLVTQTATTDDEDAQEKREAEPATTSKSNEPSGGPSTEISRYLAQILPLIAKQKFYPRASLLNEETGIVEVRVQLSNSGHLENYEIKKSSGFPNLDAAALKTLQSISSFPPPPSSLPSPLSLTVPINYELNPDH